MSESGFYKAKDGELLHAPNAVYGKGFTLKREAKLSGEKGLNPPVSGWYWFDTRQDALDFFGIKEELEPSSTVLDILVEHGVKVYVLEGGDRKR